jgi:hypothetical protein
MIHSRNDQTEKQKAEIRPENITGAWRILTWSGWLQARAGRMHSTAKGETFGNCGGEGTWVETSFPEEPQSGDNSRLSCGRLALDQF